MYREVVLLCLVSLLYCGCQDVNKESSDIGIDYSSTPLWDITSNPGTPTIRILASETTVEHVKSTTSVPGLNEKCTSTEDCHHIQNGICKENICICGEGYVDIDNYTCVLDSTTLPYWTTTASENELRALGGGNTIGDTQVEYESDAPGGVVIVGQPFSLTCRLHIHDVVRWDKDNQAVNCTNCRFLEERDALQGILTSRLFINSATLSDAGNYKCNSFANEEYHISVIFGEPTVNTNLDGKECKNLTLKSSLVLQCNLTEGNYTNLTWYRDNTTVIAAKDSKDRDRIRFDGTKLIIERAEEGDAGNYTCVFTLKNKEVKGYIPVGMKPIVNLKPSFTAIEGEKLKVECKVSLGWPPATISWRLNGIEYKADETNVNGSRVKILDSDQKIPNALFVLYDVKMDDRGNITCIASKTEFYNTTTEDTANIRVKDKLAALWPFLGICAEVVVLCAIILIYEKKRNKTELEESDTDQSPEQKNTPDHGKDSVRHRK